jgi:prolyl oligopeptidase
VIRVDLDRPAPDQWVEVIPEAPETLIAATFAGDLLFAQYLKDAHSVVRIYTPEGAPKGEVALPGIGFAAGFSADGDAGGAYWSYTSFVDPGTLYRVDLATGTSREFRRTALGVDPDRYVVEQVFYTSKDGTRVPMFIVRKKDVPLDGSAPTLLYGYGGFANPQLPAFQPQRLVWLEMGGIFALANLRGGAEYGREWHEAGILDRKQNVFDDFVAAAEWLVANDYTRPDKLAIQGRSNGGLLVGAVLEQRPELFGAALPMVGVMDMLRYQVFTVGRAWASDYGTAEDPAMFPHLLAYSPVHNAHPAKYPATLVTTADHDDRVVPAHSYKFTAALQAAQRGPEPILIRIETEVGHGAGVMTPASVKIAEVADQWAFLVWALEMTPTL